MLSTIPAKSPKTALKSFCFPVTINRFKSEFEKDEKELTREKEELIKKIKKYKKEDIIPKKPKLTIWKRIKMILMHKILVNYKL